MRSDMMRSGPLRLILGNSTWLIVDRVVRLTLGVLVGAWVARFLGPLSFGKLSYTVAYVGLFQTVATLSFDALVVRDIAREPEAAGRILGTVFTLRLLSGSACWLAAIAGMMLIKGPYDPYVMLSALLGMTLVFQAADAVDLWFQSQSQNRRSVVAKLGAAVAANVVKLLLIYTKAPLLAFAGVLAFETAAGALALAIVYRRLPSPFGWHFRRAQALRLLGESWPFMVAAAVNLIQARVEYVMIESYLGASSLGQYAAAARFVEIFDIVFISLAVSIFPRISIRGKEHSVTSLRRVYLLATLTYLAITPLLCLVWLSLGLIYGAGYGEARQLFPLMALRPLLGYFGITKGMAIRITFWSPYALISSIIGAIVAVAGAAALLPHYGLYGAVAASLGSFLVSNVLLDAVFFRANFSNLVNCWREWPYFARLVRGR